MYEWRRRKKSLDTYVNKASHAVMLLGIIITRAVSPNSSSQMWLETRVKKKSQFLVLLCTCLTEFFGCVIPEGRGRAHLPLSYLL